MFRFRDLLIVCAVALGVCGGIYRQEIVDASRKVAAPVWWYVDAPTREAEMDRLHADQIAKFEAEIGSLRAEVARMEARIKHGDVLRDEAMDALCRVTSDRDDLRGEVAGLRARYANLCQRLLELGNDVPSVLAGE